MRAGYYERKINYTWPKDHESINFLWYRGNPFKTLKHDSEILRTLQFRSSALIHFMPKTSKKTRTGFDLSFGSAIVKIYPFTTLC